MYTLRMKGRDYEIVERSSGYWIVDGQGYTEGPYDSVEEAEKDVPKVDSLQYPLPLDLPRLVDDAGVDLKTGKFTG